MPPGRTEFPLPFHSKESLLVGLPLRLLRLILNDDQEKSTVDPRKLCFIKLLFPRFPPFPFG